LSGHIGRIGGRQVVAVLALGGGLLLGPLLPAQAAQDHETGPADAGSAPTAVGTAHERPAQPAAFSDGHGPGPELR
jgi:hypothetical protein